MRRPYGSIKLAADGRGSVSTFLLEIGTEELPADFARLALPQLEAAVRRDLSEQRLPHGAMRCTSTPRRLVLSIEDLAAAQPDLADERKGPPASQAFVDGVATQAAVGFAARCGVAVEALEVRDTPKGPFVFALVKQQGRSADALLAELIPGWISGLQGRRFMRWADGECRFSRPVRWLVALLDQQVVPVVLSGSDPVVEAGRSSRGHRLHQGAVAIASASSYWQDLAAAGVVVDRQSRATAITAGIAREADRLDADADLPEELLEELTDLVEAPLLLEGAVAERYLGLPPEVLSTVMRAHQRYVPLLRRQRDADPLALEAHGVLLPRFLCVGNGLPEASDSVRRGNERVLKARLADAEFFVRVDRERPSIDRRDQLARVTFAEGLGSLRDRVERLEWCTDVLLEQLQIAGPEAEHARRAAHLCKHDLVSQMVGEFPELEGMIGGKYLLAEGEARPVALAVLEHYQPRGAGDALPQSTPGAVLALAERLELLLSIFAKGERPTGSSDPYALRRAGNGVLQILWDRGWRLNLAVLLERATLHWRELFPTFGIDAAALSSEIGGFLCQRIASLLEEGPVATDLVQAVAGDTVEQRRLLQDPGDARQRLDLLERLRGSGELAAVQAVVTRASRLADKSDLAATVLSAAGVVDAALFAQPTETAMLQVLDRLEPLARGCFGQDPCYGELAAALAEAAPTLAAFFDGDQSVMVMADDPAVRTNRLNLLAVLRNQAAVLADFGRIAG